jgi:hypothetical protein
LSCTLIFHDVCNYKFRELPPNFLQNVAPSSSRNDVVQVEEHEENDDLMEEDDGTNQMIQDFFSHSDEDVDNDGIYDGPLLEKEDKRLYKGSRENILSTTLLLVNLKVMNHLSTTCMTQILRYVIYFI